MHKKFLMLSLAFAVPYAYAGGKGISGKLNDLAGKKSGIAAEDLSRFYDGFKTTGNSGGGSKGARPHAISVNRLIIPETQAAPYADIIPSPAPPIPAYEPAADVKGGGRALTGAELATLRKIYGDKIDYSRVRIVSGDDMTLWGKILTRGSYGVTWGDTIYFPNDKNGGSLYSYESDPDWLVHEMAHVYQHQKGGWGYFPTAMWEQLTQGYGAYRYRIEPGKEFGKYGIEHQATIIQDYYSGEIPPASVPEVERLLRAEGLLGGSGGG